ncbi:MAG: penicillin-binding transpeptidase domain-containing protein, partial [Gammaproteobacteria bacterium]|nr:penicillin-binding transpeptidase domain-containing protein [Gammaproteobacteria bacterium]
MKVVGKPLMPWRRVSLLLVFLMAVIVLLARALDMQILRSEFFQRQGDARQLRVVSIPAHRGQIVDRNGEPFAVSTPVNSIWLNPGAMGVSMHRVPELAQVLSMDAPSLKKKILAQQEREFMYLKRRVSPELAEKVMNLAIPGVALQDEYRRYYPTGEVAAHVIGFSNVDDNGQEGIELAFNDWLKGEPGRKRVIRDRLGRVFDDVEHLRSVEPGKPVVLSLDRRLQYLTYRTLKAAVIKHNAIAGSAVVLDAKTGVVLAMVSQPSFNVNDRSQLTPEATRNRSVTDVFEPGSTMKPLSMAAALESGVWNATTKIDTSPGYMKVQGNMIRDSRNYGNLDVSGVITKSSNVGMSKIVLAIDADEQWDMYQNLGLGASSGSGFPGEAVGRLSTSALNSDFARATMAFGYGVSVTPLQLARAYTALAADGVLRPVSFLYQQNEVEGVRI